MGPSRSAPPFEERRIRVLIVDDDRALANGMRRLLRVHFDAISANGMQEALDLLASGERFDVIVCDVMMPNGSGVDLYEELSKRGLHDIARIIFVTGGVLSTREREFIESVANPVLTKPVDIATLRRHLHALSGARAPKP